ncbi:MAG: MFS transporter [Candidatus Acidiferrales bacterium]
MAAEHEPAASDEFGTAKLCGAPEREHDGTHMNMPGTMKETRSSDVRWLLIFWLFVLSCVAFLDRVNMSIAGSSIADSYHLTNVQLGWVFSAFLAGYALFQTVGGWLADRLGPRRVLAVGVIWWGIFTALTALVPPAITGALLIFVAIRFSLGAGEAVIYPASNQFVARWIPVNERGIANGWIFAGVGVGAGVAPPLVTRLMVHHGWRVSFWVCAAIGVAAGAVWFAIARDTPQQHPWVSACEREKISVGLTLGAPGGEAIEASTVRARIPWGKILTSREVWAVTVSYFCFGYVAWIFFSWFYIYLAKVRGLNLKTSALYAMLPFIAMAVCCIIGGQVNDWLTKRRGERLGRCGLAAFSIALTAVFLIVGARASSAQVASLVLAGGAGALYLAQSSFWSVTADIGGKSSGSVSGFMNMGAQAGGWLTAWLTPVIALHYGWPASFFAAAALCVVGAVAWLLVDPTQRLAE